MAGHLTWKVCKQNMWEVQPPAIAVIGFQCIDSFKVLGISISHRVSFMPHVANLRTSCVHNILAIVLIDITASHWPFILSFMLLQSFLMPLTNRLVTSLAFLINIRLMFQLIVDTQPINLLFTALLYIAECFWILVSTHCTKHRSFIQLRTFHWWPYFVTRLEIVAIFGILKKA